MTHSLNNENIEQFLNRFESLDGAVLVKFSYLPSKVLADATLELLMVVSDTSIESDKPYGNSTQIKISFSGNIEFKMYESGGGSNVVINEEVTFYNYDDKLYLNFDSLNSKNWSNEEWTINEIRESRFYIGADSVFWEICVA